MTEVERKPAPKPVPVPDRADRREASLLRWIRLQTVLTGVIVLLLAAAVVFISVELSSVHRSLELVEEDLQQLQMDTVNQAISAMNDAANRLAQIDTDEVNRTVTSLRQAADGLGQVDMDSLNRAIVSLKDAADTLKKLDMDSLNEVVASLESASANLEKITGPLAKLFGGKS